MERAEVDRWLEAYVAAWSSYDPDQIGALFSEDVRYRYYPYDPAFEGREAVVRSWLGENEAEGASGRDAEGTYDASYATVAIDGDVRCRRDQHVLHGAGRGGREGLLQLLRDALRCRWPLLGVHRVVQHRRIPRESTAAAARPY